MIGAVDPFIGELLLAVVARPDAAGEVWRESDEPDVVRSGRRSGLAGGRHAALKLKPLAGSLSHDVLQGAGQEDRGVPRDRGVGFRGAVENDISLRIEHAGVEDGLGVGAAVCDGGVGGRQLQVGDAPVDTAEGQRLIDIVGLIERCDAVF